MRGILYIHVNKGKDKKSAFIARGHSLQSSLFCFSFLTASIKTTESDESPVTPRLAGAAVTLERARSRRQRRW